MTKTATIFGYTIAEAPDDCVLWFIHANYPRYIYLLSGIDLVSWLQTWEACVEEAKYRGLLPLDAWALWAKEAA